MNVCEKCAEMGIENCKYCSFGNPCLGCEDYDIENDTCKSNGGCADSGLQFGDMPTMQSAT